MLHRDRSSLSRFERGQTTPRDLEAVVAVYDSLMPPASHPRWWTWAAWTGVRWGLLGLAIVVSRYDAQTVRLFVVVSAVILLLTVARKTLPGWRGLLIFVCVTIPLGLLTGYMLADLDKSLMLDPALCAWQTWVELSLFVWSHMKVDQQAGEFRTVFGNERARRPIRRHSR